MVFNNSVNNLFRQQKVVNSAINYVVLADDVIINITDTTAPRTVTLPAPSATNVGKSFTIKDTSGAASTNNITITPAAGNIDGAASSAIDVDYGSLIAYSDGSNYFIESVAAAPETGLIVSTITADPAPALLENMYLVDTSSGVVTVTLPDATIAGSLGKSVVIQKKTSDGNTVIVQTTAAQTINGIAAPVLLVNRGDAVTFTSDGTNWQIQSDNRIGQNQLSNFIGGNLNGNQLMSGVNTTITWTDVAGNIPESAGIISLTGGRTYLLYAELLLQGLSGSGSSGFRWLDSSNVALPNTVQTVIATSGTFGLKYQGTQQVIYTPSVDTDVKLAITTPGASGSQTAIATGSSFYVIEIGSFSTTPEYSYATKAANQVVAAAPVDVSWDTPAGNIPFTTPSFTLQAGKVYSLTAALATNSFTTCSYIWVDSTNTQLPDSNIGTALSPRATADDDSVVPATALVVPTSTMDVKLRVITTAGSSVISGSDPRLSSYAFIQQLGSTAQVGPSLPSRTVLGSSFSSSTNATWLDSGLNITVPAGTYRIGYNGRGSVENNSAGIINQQIRLFDVTAGAAVNNSNRYLAVGGYVTGFSGTSGGSASFDVRVTNVIATTYRVDIRKDSGGGSPNLSQNMNLIAESYIEYRNDEF